MRFTSTSVIWVSWISSVSSSPQTGLGQLYAAVSKTAREVERVAPHASRANSRRRRLRHQTDGPARHGPAAKRARCVPNTSPVNVRR